MQGKRKRAIFILAILVYSGELFSVGVPDSLREFAHSYGTWFGGLLEKTPLKNLLSDDERIFYQKFHQFLVNSEIMAEQGEFTISRSYQKKAQYLLEEIYQDLALKYHWNKDYNHKYKPPLQTKEEVRGWVTWRIQYLYKLLEQEYLLFLEQGDTRTQTSIIEQASFLYNSLPSGDRMTASLEKEKIPEYIRFISELTPVNDHNTQPAVNKITGHFDQQKQLSTYGEVKMAKRAIVLLNRMGYPENSLQVALQLKESDENLLSDGLYLPTLLLGGGLKKTEQYLEQSRVRFDKSSQRTWHRYIEQTSLMIRLYIAAEQYESATREAGQLYHNLIDLNSTPTLPHDISQYLEKKIIELSLLLKSLSSNYIQETHPISAWLSPSSETRSSLDPVIEKLLIWNSYQNKQLPSTATREQSPNLLYREFQIALYEDRSPQKALSLFSLIPQKAQTLKSIATLELLLAGIPSGNDPYTTWYNALLTLNIVKPEQLRAETGIILSFSYQKELIKFLETKSSLFKSEQWRTLFSLISTEKHYPENLLTPPPYYNPEIQRFRYNYINNHIFQKDYPTAPLMQPGLTANANKAWCNQRFCWSIFPVNNEVISLLWESGIPEKLIWQKRSGARNLPLVIDGIQRKLDQTAVNGSLYTPELEEFSSFFREELEYITGKANSPEKKTIKLSLWGEALNYPVELLLTKPDNTPLAKDYHVVRSFPFDPVFNSLTHPGIQALGNKTKETNTDNQPYLFIGYAPPASGKDYRNELPDLEPVFSNKLILHKIQSKQEFDLLLHKETNSDVIVHFTGEMEPEKGKKDYATPLSTIQTIFRLLGNQIDLFIFNPSRANQAHSVDNLYTEKVLIAGSYTDLNFVLTPLYHINIRESQAFFYDFYYRLERKKTEKIEAYIETRKRMQKGFPGSLWPLTLVIYEKD